jgi:hypothetical protein
MAILVKSRLSSDLQILVKFARYFFGFFLIMANLHARANMNLGPLILSDALRKGKRELALFLFSLSRIQKNRYLTHYCISVAQVFYAGSSLAPLIEHLSLAAIFGCSLNSAPQSPHFKNTAPLPK